MEDLFARIVLGHLVGDYMLQSKVMALKKSEPGMPGFMLCALHCIAYTASLCLFLWTIRPEIVLLIFLSHWPIDRWSLGSRWLTLIRGRNFKVAYTEKSPYWEIDVSFSCLVYTVVDATLHLIPLWLIVRFAL